MADMLDISQFHHAISQEAQRPAGLPGRTGAARQRDQMSFLLSIQGPCSRLGVKAVVERIIQSIGHKTLANADDCVTAHLECLSHLLIGPAGSDRKSTRLNSSH